MKRRTVANIRLPGNVGVLLALLMIAFSCCWIPVASAQNEPVNIPDSVLRQRVEAALGLNLLQSVTRTNILNLRTVSYIPGDFIEDLTGLEYATNLQTLALGNHKISDLTPLAGLTDLTSLNLRNNKISDVTPLAKLTNVQTLYLSGNEISDTSPLRNLTNLTTLGLSRNTNLGANLEGLRSLTALEILLIENTNARDLTPLAGMTNLKRLHANENQITDISPLRSLTNLGTLFLHGNKIRDISPLQGLTELLVVTLEGNEIRDISPIAGWTHLKVDWTRLYPGPELAFAPSLFRQSNYTNPLSYPSIYTHLPTILGQHSPTQLLVNYNVFLHIRIPTTLEGVSADSQTVGYGESLPLTVRVLDENGVPFAGVPVVFAVTEGDGTLEPGEVATLDPTYNLRDDEEGEAKTTFTPGSNLGRYTVVATVIHKETPLTRGASPYTRRDEFVIEEKTLEVVFTINVLPGASPPDAPTLVTTGPALPTSLQVSWTASVYAVEGYEFRYRIEGSEAWIDAAHEGTETSATLSDLIPGTTYEWQVRAQTSVGPGPWSAVNRGTTGYVLLQTRELAPSPVASDRLVFNELRNANDDKHDWLEVKNISGADMSLADWEISIVASAGQDVDIVAFPDDTLPAGEVLLIVNTDPGETDLASGVNIATGVGKKGAKHRYLVSGKLKLPQTSYLLLLRSATDKNGTAEALEDVAGNYFRETGDFLYGAGTQVWPLQDTERPLSADAAPLTAGGTWARVSTEKRGYLAAAWSQRGYQAGLGYERGAAAATSLGTPGYANTALTAAAPSGRVSISELMFAKKAGRRTVPQWIELYNHSMTEAVKLEGWQLEVEYLSEENARRHRFDSVSLTPLTVLPNQTVLLVTWRAETSGHFPEGRLYNLYFEHPAAFNQRERRHEVLNPAGFSVRLLDAGGTLVDSVGNLDGVARTKDAPTWDVPSGTTADGARVSLIRKYEDSAPLPGTDAASWVSASAVKLAVSTYYGWETDLGTPGYRDGGPLPVVLSHFQPVWTETGVVVRWTTESALDNAGFNLLRGTSLQGPFTKLHPALIAGAGTTGEAQVYTFPDATAKPGVVYYYRLEEVSLGGARQVLATTRLRGQVAARGKLTTRWSELKSTPRQ